jgi:flagellar basal body-associated protein FliL
VNKKKIIIIALVVLLGGGYVAKGMVFPPKVVKMKIDGMIYILPKQFMINLKDGRYSTLTVALVLAPGQTVAAADAAAPAPPDGFGTLPEEPAIRDIITNTLTNETSPALISTSGRDRLKHQILKAITSGTDVKIVDVLFTDVAVQ